MPSPARLSLLVAVVAASLSFAPAVGGQSGSQRNVRILGGATAAHGQFPWMVMLVDTASPSASDGFSCGGTLIAPRVVMTAAHCVPGLEPRELDVVVGRLRLSADDEGERIDITKILSYPEYNPDADKPTGDLALLQLAQPVTSIVPATLASPEATAKQLSKAGARVLTSGWGATSEGGDKSDALKYVRLRVRSSKYCDRIYGPVDGARTLCIRGSSAGGEDSCQGDSGGPVFAGEDASAKILGIVSYGAGCGRPGVPGVYTRVSAYEGWIREQSGFLNGDTTPPPPPPAKPRVKIGRISCASIPCTIHMKVTGRDPAGGIVVNVVRNRRKGRKAVDRYIVARKRGGTHWVARNDLPYGRLTIYAFPFNEAIDELDGDGDVTEISIVRG